MCVLWSGNVIEYLSDDGDDDVCRQFTKNARGRKAHIHTKMNVGEIPFVKGDRLYVEIKRTFRFYFAKRADLLHARILK